MAIKIKTEGLFFDRKGFEQLIMEKVAQSRQFQEFVNENNKKEKGNNMQLTENEILVLKALDGRKSIENTPEGLTDAQYYAAARTLHQKKLVYAGFVEGGSVEAMRILYEGQAVLDDMKRDEKRILRRLIAEEGLTQDQYDLLLYVKANRDCKNIFNVRRHYFMESIAKPLFGIKLINIDRGELGNPVLLTRLGQQILEKIEDELNYQLSCRYQEGYSADQFTHHENIQTINNHERDDENDNDDDVQEDEALINELLPLCYQDKETVKEYIKRLRTISSNPEKVEYTAELIKARKISDTSCRRPLWKVLNTYGLYDRQEGTWTRAINKNL